MLRITVEEKADFTRFRLEGKLTGDWVKALERCWICAKHIAPETRFKIDLSGVSLVEEKGKALLESIVSEGAELLADGPMMTSLANSIVENASSCDRYKKPGIVAKHPRGKVSRIFHTNASVAEVAARSRK